MQKNIKMQNLNYLYENLPNGLITLSGILIIIGYSIHEVVELNILVTWLGFNVLVLILRTISFIYYSKGQLSTNNYSKYYLSFFILTSISALSLGSGAYFIFPETLNHQMVILFLLVILTSEALVSLASDRKLFYIYIIVILLPYSFIYLISSIQELNILSVIIFIYIIILFRLSKKIFINILLSYKNKNLILQLKKKINETLLLQKSLQVYKDIVDEVSIVSKVNSKGIITYVNKHFCESSGYTEDELIGQNHNIIRHPDMPSSAFKEMWHTVKDLKKSWTGKVKNRKKDGTYYWVDAFIKPIYDLDGNIIEYIGLRNDITENENYKDILRDRLDDKSKSLEENMNYISQYEEANSEFTAIIKTDVNNVITYANEMFCELSGYTLKELVGMNCQDLKYEKHIKNHDCKNIQKKLMENKHHTIVFTNIAKDSSLYFVDTIIYPITDINGEVVEHLHLMHDISELTNIHKEIEETQKEIVYKMGEIGESRSKETGNHVKRVAEYSRVLAKLHGLGENECEILFTASPMHDIGKIAIPDNILKKPGKLTKEEFKIMKSHSEIGYSVLKGSEREVLKAAAIVAYHHHEKWNGQGYPQGLKGENIHIYGRITSIADVFDALGSDRCYKKAWEDERIFQLFKEEKGNHFDPKLTDLFLEHKEMFFQIRDKYKD